MRIAICEDEAQDLEHISALLGEYKTVRDVGLSIYTFQNTKDLIGSVKGGEYDVILLDVLIPGPGGIKTARELRALDQNVRILFLSSSPEFAVESYAVGAYYYLLKPVAAKTLFPLLDKLRSELNRQKDEALLLHSRGGFVSISFSRLEYVEVMNKTVSFHLTDGSVREVNGSLSDFEDEILSHSEFMKVHRSYLLNLRQVQSVNAKGTVTKMGHTVPVARSLYAAVKAAYLNLMVQPQPPAAPISPPPVPRETAVRSGPWRILLVDDKPEDLALYSKLLREHGCIVENAQNGAEAIHLAASARVDCVLLDVMLPGEEGFSVCSRLREQTDAPVIFLSCLTDAQKQLQGFTAGGIDYITKDTPADLFWAKMETRIRLARSDQQQLSFAPLLLDLSSRRVLLEEQELILTPTEFDLLWLLANHAFRVYTPEEIYRSVWGDRTWDGGKTVQLHMSRLRRKLEKAYPTHYFLETVWGQGYRFVPAGQKEALE